MARVPLWAAIVVTAALAAAGVHAQPFKWGGDAEGGAPYVEADAQHPERVVGLDVEIAELIAKELGRPAEFVQIAFTSATRWRATLRTRCSQRCARAA